MIFHFGFFSLMAGMWSIGECNYTGVIVKNPTLLYLCFYRAFLADDSAAVFLQACSWF